jgi:hypothetical protein
LAWYDEQLSKQHTLEEMLQLEEGRRATLNEWLNKQLEAYDLQNMTLAEQKDVWEEIARWAESYAVQYLPGIHSKLVEINNQQNAQAFTFRNIMLQSADGIANAFSNFFMLMTHGVRNLGTLFSDMLAAVEQRVMDILAKLAAAGIVNWIIKAVGIAVAIAAPEAAPFVGSVGGVGIPIGMAAEGGYVTKPTLLLAGEHGPEKITPLGRREGEGQHLHVGSINLGVDSLDEMSLRRLMRRLNSAYSHELWRGNLRLSGSRMGVG